MSLYFNMLDNFAHLKKLYTLEKPCEWFEDIKKSKFLTKAFPLQAMEDFSPLLDEAKKQAASHHCWAWKFGEHYRFSDDGEPSGTAGKPILNAIENNDCDRVAIIITRWFGGIELGTGGLARAYGNGAVKCLKAAQLIEIIEWHVLSFHCPFHFFNLLESNIEYFNAIIEQRDFDEQGCVFILKLPQSNVASFMEWLKDKSSGQIIFAQQAVL